MKRSSNRLTFFGSGPVAAASLAHLGQHWPIVNVVTKSTTLAMMKAVSNPFQGVITKFYTADSRLELDQLIAEKKLNNFVGIIVDYGVIVSPQTIDYFEHGIVNAHFSLLPRWRGADPISHAILAGDQKTGVSLMLLEPSLDTGKLLVQKSLAIKVEDDTLSLTEKLINLSNQLFQSHLDLYISGKLSLRAQPHPNRATYSSKIKKSQGIIDWHKPADILTREIRAFTGWPKSSTKLGSVEVIITKAHTDETPSTHYHQPGSLIIDQVNKTLGVATTQRILWLDKLKPVGKAEMSIEAFLAGYKNRLS